MTEGQKTKQNKTKTTVYSRTADLILEMRHGSYKALDVCCVCGKERGEVGTQE